MIPPLHKKSYSFQKNVLSTLKQHNLLKCDESVVVGVSGGSDSVALLKVLASAAMNLKLIAVYIDHGLRPTEVPLEIERVAQLCTALKVTFFTKTVDVQGLSAKEGRSIEDAARILRYQSLESVRKQYNYSKIAVGHHGDDQVEEFFIRLIRGTGVTGLSGMKPQYENVIRPLLFETKESIQAYLVEHNISWSNDSSNEETHFLRNRIRNQLLPFFEQNYNPSVKKTVLNTMNILGEENLFLEEMARDQFTLCTTVIAHSKDEKNLKELSLDLGVFFTSHLAIRRRILEKICWEMHSKPSFSAIQDINTLAETGDNGKELHLKNGLRIIKQDTCILFQKPHLLPNKRGSELPFEPFEIRLKEPGSYPIPHTPYTVSLSEFLGEKLVPSDKTDLLIDREKVEFPLTIRTSYPGEKITINKGSGRKKISRYFNEIKLDKRKRTTWPILASNDQVIAIVGYTTNYHYRVNENTNSVLHISLHIGDLNL